MATNNRYQVYLPFIVGFAFALGLFLGSYFFTGDLSYSGKKYSHVDKLREVIQYIERDYADTVNTNQLVDKTINKMLEELDPHSSYIPPKNLKLAKSQLEGNFEGIGIEFNIIRDTIYVVAPLSGGPSEAVGIRAGDKIVKVNGKNVVGLSTREVIDTLRGTKGTKVNVAIKRNGKEELLSFTITRDKIPTYSVEADFMVDDSTGIIKITRFTASTHEEFTRSLSRLKDKGLQRLMVDLRDNPGGYLNQAKKIADEFISGNKMIVYTKGKNPRYNKTYHASDGGMFEKGPLVLLINEGSASASEILAGAVQDNDRGLIVGRRSFGKGLVQTPLELNNGAELRLTISRYYTPSGRCIQKPYEDNKQDYNKELLQRHNKGEYFHSDSIQVNDSLKYETLHGRTVYGGGGIMPDFFVPKDTANYTDLLGQLYLNNLLREFSLNYANRYKDSLKQMGLNGFINRFRITPSIRKDFISLIQKTEIEYNEEEFKTSWPDIKNSLKALTGRTIWDDEAYYKIKFRKDRIYQNALKLFDKARELEQKGTLSAGKHQVKDTVSAMQ